jgi:ATP-dependent DNA helicase RecQ
VELPVSDIAKRLAASRNEMTTRTALTLLERAGFIERDYAPGSRTYTTRLVQPARSFDDLQIDFRRLEIKRQRDMAKLQQVIRYADERACRSRYILKYFGDAAAEAACGSCDICAARATTAARMPEEDETVILQKILSCVARMKGRFGRGRVVQTLAGSHAKEVLDAGLDRLPTYGLLADLGTEHIWRYLDALVHAGCIAILEGKYPTISLTDLGMEVMHKRKSVPLNLPPPAVAARASFRDTKRSARENSDEIGEEPYDHTLFEALRRWRRVKAEEMGHVPAYVIYPDSTLKELARRMPRTEAELLEVRGIGPAKVRQYGRETLAIIQHDIAG